jgi:hypothetical protein
VAHSLPNNQRLPIDSRTFTATLVRSDEVSVALQHKYVGFGQYSVELTTSLIDNFTLTVNLDGTLVASTAVVAGCNDGFVLLESGLECGCEAGSYLPNPGSSCLACVRRCDSKSREIESSQREVLTFRLLTTGLASHRCSPQDSTRRAGGARPTAPLRAARADPSRNLTSLQRRTTRKRPTQSHAKVECSMARCPDTGVSAT